MVEVFQPPNPDGLCHRDVGCGQWEVLLFHTVWLGISMCVQSLTRQADLHTAGAALQLSPSPCTDTCAV